MFLFFVSVLIMEANLKTQITLKSRQNQGLKKLIILLKTFKTQDRIQMTQKKGITYENKLLLLLLLGSSWVLVGPVRPYI